MISKKGKDRTTKIIINVAGKEKTLGFSNTAIAKAFIKGASAKFGDKFGVMHLPEQCPECGSLGNHETYYKDGTRYNPFEKGSKLWDYFVCADCEAKWPFKFIHVEDQDKPVTSGMSDIDAGAPSFKSEGAKLSAQKTEYPSLCDPCIQWYRAKKLPLVMMTGFGTPEEVAACDRCGRKSTLAICGVKNHAADTKYINAATKVAESLPPEDYRLCYQLQRELRLPYGDVVTAYLQYADKPPKARYEYARDFLQKQKQNNEANMVLKEASGMNFSPSNVPSQVVQEFYPELQHEIISYPNVTNAPMVNPEITGDMHEVGPAKAEGIGEAELLPGALEDAFEGLTVVSYVSTSPAGAMGIARDGKPQVLEGAPLRKENDIRGPMFTDEFYQNYSAVPGAALASLSHRVAASEEKQQFSLFLKKVMGEVAASFVAAFKVTSRMPMNKVPGIGEIQLAQIEQPSSTNPGYNIINTGSRVKYLMDKLSDSEIQDCVNAAFCQGAIWHEAKEGGFVYEVFVRAETIDTESMLLTYKFVTGTREADES